MNELERAATALLDRPPAPPAPLAQIERRAATIRRRRRVLEAGAIALILLLLGTAGLALGAARDDGQGVFVGEGPPKEPAVTIATYRLGSPVDEATAEALELTIGSRFGSIGLGVPDVQISGTEVTVTTTGPPDDINDINFLVARSGGFELHPVLGDAPEADCASPSDAAAGGAMGTSGLTGLPRCLSVGPAVPLPPDPSTVSASGVSANGTYQLDLILTPVASQALVDTTAKCPEQACLPATIAVATDGVILHPEAQVTPSMTDAGMAVRIAMRGLSDPATAERWASVLVHPLPDGVVLTRVFIDPSSTTTVVTSSPAAGSPLPSDGANSRLVCIGPPVEDALLDAARGVLQARFAAIGRSVEVVAVGQQGIAPYVNCLGGQGLVVSSDYPPDDADWLGDQTALLQAGILRSRVGGTVLHPISATSRGGDASTEGRPNVVVELPAGEFDAMSVLAPTVQCLGQGACWLAVDIDGVVPTTDFAREAPPSSIVLVLAPGEEARAARLAALLDNPLPDGVSLQP